MVPLLLVLLIVLIFFGLGFVLKALWIVALVALAIWLIGFLVRSPGPGGGRGRWYRW
ncbi:hypothetical protein [Streptomyces sp. NRRL S-337]|uniref:hypothetical protein n=1 Tax=Streptomyces sp. NRRL S-337 TaxID=1463900 RepID=UPI0004C6F7FA|nr:hypothetical protein [Streptomyces sp. NRRL S-337]